MLLNVHQLALHMIYYIAVAHPNGAEGFLNCSFGVKQHSRTPLQIILTIVNNND